jgi:hypothetical protein
VSKALKISKAVIFIFVVAAIQMTVVFSQTALLRDEQAVYAAIFKTICNENLKTYNKPKCHFVIVSTTQLDDEVISDWKQGYVSAFTNLKKRNNHPIHIDEMLLPYKYELAPKEEIESLMDQGRKIYEAKKEKQQPNEIILGTEYWIPFYIRFPHAVGLHTISAIGFDTPRNVALVNIRFESNLVGFSRLYVLRKGRSGWKILKWSGIQSIA